MRRRRSWATDERAVSASELAQMGRCEKLVLFEHLYGTCRLDEQQHDRMRGLLAHERFYKEGLAASAVATPRKGRCFIATCVFGEGWQTGVLRRFRDEALRPRPWGRFLIKAYYLLAPGACMVLNRWPALKAPARAILGAMVRGLTWRWRGDEE
jgi:hypothetical protein